MKIGKSLFVEKTDTLSGHRDCIYALEKSATENFVFSAGGDGLVVRWDLAQPELGHVVAQVAKSVYALCFVESQNALLVGQNMEGVHRINLGSQQQDCSVKLENAAIFDIKVFEKQEIVLAAMQSGSVFVLDFRTLKVLQVLKHSEKSARRIAISEKLQQMAVAYSDGCIRIFDLRTWQMIHAFEAHQHSVFALQYSPDGQQLVSGGRDAHLKIWETREYMLQKDIAAHLFAINDLVFSPDAQYLATCSMDKSIKLWSATDFQLLKVIDKARHAGHGTSINKLLWTTFQNKLVSASDDRNLSVWRSNLWD